MEDILLLYGFVTTLQRLMDEEAPEAVCVTFDRKEPTFRHLEYEGYKAQRKGMPEELAQQMPVLNQLDLRMLCYQLKAVSVSSDNHAVPSSGLTLPGDGPTVLSIGHFMASVP